MGETFLICVKVTGFTAGLMGQANIGNPHGPINGLAHIINGQGSNRYGAKGFHLNTRAAVEVGGGKDFNATVGAVAFQINLYIL